MSRIKDLQKRVHRVLGKLALTTHEETGMVCL